jgi:hypothetical protein
MKHRKLVCLLKQVLTIAKALAYCTMELITTVKSFMIQAPGANYIEKFGIEFSH